MEQHGGPRASREHWYQQLEAESEHELVTQLRRVLPTSETHVCSAAKKRLLKERIGYSVRLMRSESLTRVDRERYGSIARSVAIIDALQQHVFFHSKFV